MKLILRKLKQIKNPTTGSTHLKSKVLAILQGKI